MKSLLSDVSGDASSLSLSELLLNTNRAEPVPWLMLSFAKTPQQEPGKQQTPLLTSPEDWF